MVAFSLQKPRRYPGHVDLVRGYHLRIPFLPEAPIPLTAVTDRVGITNSSLKQGLYLPS
jgi:hypothetical protein